MGKRDTFSPDENLAPTDIMRRMAEVCSTSTPAKRARITSPVPGRIAVAGRVASVKLQNFMCHANLQIDFKTQENNCFYIGGPNGSGKSALFAAINLGLGGRGSDNDRGSTVKSYIKDGTTQAKICITLTNGGLNAHPDYDDLISIERTINQSSSTYVMKSIKLSHSGHQTEKIISKKKSDIDRIISRFNIHLTNPAFWMSQDRSRSFLANFKPSNVYKLYLESTNLENILLSYVEFANTIKDTRNQVEMKIAEVSLENKKLKRMQEQRELQAKVEADRELLSSYNWKILFVSVRDYDAQIMLNQKHQEVQKKLNEQCKLEYLENRNERAVVEKKIQQVCDDIELAQEDVEEAKSRLDEASKELTGIEDKIKSLESESRRMVKAVNTVKMSIDSHQQQLTAALAKQGNSHLTEKLKAVESDYLRVSKETEQMEVSGEFNRLKQKLDDIKDDIRSKENQKNEACSRISRLRRKIDENKEMIRSARATKQNTINKFGRGMAEIVAQIDKERSNFQKMPKGPVGKFVTLTDPKWALAVEECIGMLASSFLCASQQDAAVLRNIFRRLKLHPSDQPEIIVCRFTGKCYPNLREPESEFQSFYRALEISDPDVNNVIIDRTNCEKVLLFEENEVAMSIMGSDNPPRYVKRAYTLDGSQAYPNGERSQYRFYRSKGGRATGVFCGAKVNVDEATLIKEIKEHEAEIASIETSDVRRHDSELRELQKDVKNTHQAIDDYERKLSSLRREDIRMSRLIEDLRAELAQANNEDQIDTLTDTIEEFKKKIPEFEKQRQDIESEMEEWTIKLKPAFAKKKEAQKNLSDMQNEIGDFNSKTAKLNRELSDFDDKGEIIKARIDKLKAEATRLFHEEAKMKTEKDEAQETIRVKKEDYPKPPNEQDPPDLSNFPPTEQAWKVIADLKKKIDRAAQGCDMSITYDSVKSFKETLRRRRYTCRVLEETIDKLDEIHENRVKSYPLLRQYTEMKVCDKFQELLEVRGHFIGGLEFNHEKQTLNVNVQSCKEKDAMADKTYVEEDEEDEAGDGTPSGSDSENDEPRKKKAKQKKAKKPRDLKGLSGGERSFVTAALVMSLWEVMEQPFRMMDEFDVFMDMMNRKLVMDLLVEMATKKFPHNQFIFFTPQGIKELKKVDGLQVFEMNKVRD
uniref:AAA_23 domain-containing protein n=1 Tax=Caenorhabditis tropicalis TaxID=1561998 RepID=A0A1I7T228_9PELO